MSECINWYTSSESRHTISMQIEEEPFDRRKRNEKYVKKKINE